MFRKKPVPVTSLLVILGGFILCICSLLVFAYLRQEVFEKDFSFFDQKILHALYTIRSPLLTTVMLFISTLGSELMIGLGLVVISILCVKKRITEAVLFFCTVSMAVVIDTVLKNIYHRARPDFHPLLTLTDFSFPSGHAMASFVFYVSISYLVFHLTHEKRVTFCVSLLSVLIILLIGVSRVYLGVHYPTDVIAGYVAGLCWVVSTLLIERIIVFLLSCRSD